MLNKVLISDQMGHKSMKIRSNEWGVDGYILQNSVQLLYKS